MIEKVRVTVRLQIEALDLVLRHGYATRRTFGAFLSQPILDSHQRYSQSAVAAEWQPFVADAEPLLGPESSSAQ